MAQDTETIYQEMLAEKNARPELSELNTPSNTSIFQQWLRLFALLHHWMQEKWDSFKIEVQEVVDSSQYGNFEWWAAKVKAFQYGDILQFINNRWQYATIDVAKQIIYYVSISDERGLVKVKAAKIANSRPVMLNANEALGLLSYVRQIRPPGTRLAIESLPADKLKTTLIVHYNAQISEAVISAAVEAAYINYINNIDFDSIYYVNKMIDALQAIPGVIEEQVEVIELAAKQGADPYVQFTAKYQASSGYFEVDPAYPLIDTITYIGV